MLPSALAQSSAPETFTDPETGIIFNTWGIPNGAPQTQGGLTFGVALPQDALETDASEFIGYLVGPDRPGSPARSQLLTAAASNAPRRTRPAGAASPWAGP